MPANVGEMFYVGEVPWHGIGRKLEGPASMEEALREGGLNWKVGEIRLQTRDDPPSPVSTRKAIVREDLAPGDPRRVLGVVHQGFKPLQNHDGATIFDAIFGKGHKVYHTGGYLGNGEVVWLMAKIDSPILVGGTDVVEPYALYTNSHDGSRAFTISLTTVRVVCSNTLDLALQEKGMGAQFRRAHVGSFRNHAEAALEFWESTMRQLDQTAEVFNRMAKTRCDKDQFERLLNGILPFPKIPRHIERDPRQKKAYETRRAEIETARWKITSLRETGRGMEQVSAARTYWGALNAVTEYVDHWRAIKGDRLAYALLGDGRDLKLRAYTLIQQQMAVLRN